MNRLQAMKDQNIRIQIVDDEAMEVVFENGVTLPIQAWLDKDQEVETDDPVDGGWVAFGDDEIGYGYYPIKLISEEEYERDWASTRATLEARARQAGAV